ncbi:Mg-dependent DNase [Trametes maxima]|nr:Mg-dependent DNase [Trametes maxima]
MPVTVVAARPTAAQEVQPERYRYIVNLTDPIFRGYHHGKRKHDDDLDAMLERARAAGVKSMIITGGSLHESREALQLAQQLGFYATVGCHPTRSAQFDQFRGGPEKYLEELDNVIAANLIGKGRVVAVGECGLDYDRTHFAPEDVQRKHFRSQLALAKKYHLPLFLHSRAAHKDFVKILCEEGFDKDGGRAVGGRGGVVHSFTGAAEEAIELMDMGFHIGINGCSLKTADNLATTKTIRPEKLVLETDAPWCSMTSTQASKAHLASLPPALNALYFPAGKKPEAFVYGQPVKGRNEPAAIGGVAWVVCKLHGDVPLEKITEKAWKNTVELFGLTELR